MIGHDMLAFHLFPIKSDSIRFQKKDNVMEENLFQICIAPRQGFEISITSELKYVNASEILKNFKISREFLKLLYLNFKNRICIYLYKNLYKFS